MKPFRILLALDKFKGSFSSHEAALLCDVHNPVLGTQGGVRIYGPGATAEDLEVLKVAMAHWAERLVLDLQLDVQSGFGKWPAQMIRACPAAKYPRISSTKRSLVISDLAALSAELLRSHNLFLC